MNIVKSNTIKDLTLLGTLTITPEIAEELLKKNIGNRKLNKKRIEAYAKEMKEGNWYATPDGLSITVDKNYNLLNGQHRLHAIILSGVPVEMYIYMKDIIGTAENFICDNGLVRGIALLMKLSTNYIATVSTLIRMGSGHTTDVITITDIKNFTSKLQDAERDFLYKVGNSTKRGIPASLKAAYVFQYINTHDDSVATSWENLKGRILAKNTPEHNITLFIDKLGTVGGGNAVQKKIFTNTYAILLGLKPDDNSLKIVSGSIKDLYKSIMNRPDMTSDNSI